MKRREHFWREAYVRAQIAEAYVTDREAGVRAYCTQSGSEWALQLRAPRQLANGKEGKDFLIVTASLDKVEMRELRDALTRLLVEDEG